MPPSRRQRRPRSTERRLTALTNNPDKTLVYHSREMIDRRLRLLAHTRSLLVERGYELFSIREVCRRANVSPRTLYNAFQQRDRLICLALGAELERTEPPVVPASDEDSLKWLIVRAGEATLALLRVRAYAAAVTAIYFTPTTSRDLTLALRAMLLPDLARWLSDKETVGRLQPWATADRLCNHIANMTFGALGEVVAGRADRDEGVRRAVEAILMGIDAGVGGGSREQAQAYLRHLRSDGLKRMFDKPRVRCVAGGSSDPLRTSANGAAW